MKEPKEVKEEVVLNKEAYDVYLDEATRKYVRVTVKYNVETGEAKVSAVEAIADSQPVAIYKIHETLSRKVLGI